MKNKKNKKDVYNSIINKLMDRITHNKFSYWFFPKSSPSPNSPKITLMGDVLGPFTLSPPPPPSSPSSPSNSSLPMLYYGLAVVGTAAIVLAMYNLIVIRRCRRRHAPSPPQPHDRNVEVMIASSGSNWSLECSNRNLLASFKYKKEAEEVEKEGGGEDYECPVCLSVFEEGEDVRKMPLCKHSFHAVCIDMWLHSHFDCPICRTPVGRFSRSSPAEQSSRESGVSVWEIWIFSVSWKIYNVIFL